MSVSRCVAETSLFFQSSIGIFGHADENPANVFSPGDLTTSWWLEQVVGVELLEFGKDSINNHNNPGPTFWLFMMSQSRLSKSHPTPT